MPAAYSLDLRFRIVTAYKQGLGTINEIAKLFNVCRSSVIKYLYLDKKNGSPKAKPASGGPKPKIDADGLALVVVLVKEKPDITISELCQKFYDKNKVKISSSMMSRALTKLDLRRKKKSFFAQEQERADVKKKR